MGTRRNAQAPMQLSGWPSGWPSLDGAHIALAVVLPAACEADPRNRNAPACRRGLRARASGQATPASMWAISPAESPDADGPRTADPPFFASSAVASHITERAVSPAARHSLTPPRPRSYVARQRHRQTQQLRKSSEEQSVQDLEPDVLRQLRPAPGESGGIPKRHGGGTRVLGVPCVADRIAQTVVAARLEKTVEPVFHRGSYGYRPGRSALGAVAACRERCWKKGWVIDLDAGKFFDSVRWDLIVKAVQAHTDLPWVVLYVGRWLAAPLQLPGGTLRQRDRGTPQGGVPRAGQPVHALRVRHLARPGVPGCPVRALCRRRSRALCHPPPGRAGPGRDRHAHGTGRVAAASGQDPDRALQGRHPARLA